MSAHYPSGTLSCSVINNGTIQWYYNGSIFTPDQYSGGYYYHCLYSFDGSNWYSASTSTYPVTSLSLNGYIQYALVFLDSLSDTAVSTDYKKSTFTRTSTYYNAPTPSASITNYASSGYLSISVYKGSLTGYTSDFWSTGCEFYFSFDSTVISGSTISYSLLDGYDSCTIYYRGSQLASGYATKYTSWQSTSWSRSTCPTPNAATYSLNLTYDRVDITYPSYSPYTVISEYSVDGCNTWYSASGNYPLSSLWVATDKTIYIRRKCTYSYYNDSSWVTSSYSSPTCTTPGAPVCTSDGTNVNISYPAAIQYDTYSEYSVDLASTWNHATASTYPLDSLDNAAGRKIYVRSKYTRLYHYDSGWSSSGSYQEPTCSVPTGISASYNSTYNRFDITINTISGYTTKLYVKPNQSSDWIWVNDYTSSATITAYFDLTSYASGSTFYFRVINTRSHYFDSSSLDSSQYTFSQPTCPTPLTLTASQNGFTTTINATAESGYNLYVEYYDGAWTWKSTQSTPYSDTITISNRGCRYTLQLRVKCTKDNHQDSGYIYLDWEVNIRPSNSSYFNFTSSQTMTAQNVTKISDGYYTADAIIMPASTWNNFKDKVNEFRIYKGYVEFNPTYAITTNTILTATIYNDMANSITQIRNSGDSTIPTITSDDEISADRLMALQIKLNSIY